MFLHLVNDEKIINRTIDLFEEVFPGDNLFVVVSGRTRYRHVKSCRCVLSQSDFWARRDEFKITSVLIHLLNLRKIHFVNKLGLGKVPVYWIIWGADLYNKLLMPKGYELFDPEGTYCRRRKLWSALYSPIAFFQNKQRVNKTIGFIQNRVDYLVTDTTENDYDVLLHYFPELKGKPWRDFFYYPIDQILGDMIEATVQGNNIMIGNSGSLTNNHEYAMRHLTSMEINDREVIVPLSYSGKKKYLQSVIREGKSLLGDRFRPLLCFMPLSEYNKLLTSVNVAIYGNWRQEAIGNIIITLYLGAKVFISNRNPILEWARNHGLRIFELETMTQEEIDVPLSPEEKLENRTILLNLYNKKRLFELIKSTFNTNERLK